MIMGKYNAILTRLGVGQNKCSYKHANGKTYYPVHIILTISDEHDKYILNNQNNDVNNVEQLSNIIIRYPSKVALFPDEQLRAVFNTNNNNLQHLKESITIIRMITEYQWRTNDFENYMLSLEISKPNQTFEEKITGLKEENTKNAETLKQQTNKSLFSKFNSFVSKTIKKINDFRLPRVYNEVSKIIMKYQKLL